MSPAEAAPIQLADHERIVVIGAGGVIARRLYIEKLLEEGVLPEQLALVDTDPEKLAGAQEWIGGTAAGFTDTDEALLALHESGKVPTAIIIASSTAAHLGNITSIINAVAAGRLDLAQTRIWCEKPVTPPEHADEIAALGQAYPEMDIAVGYILRFSQTVDALQKYLETTGSTITSLDWVYGKDRRDDSRPTQGVLADEAVHPLSVTDLVLQRAFGEVTKTEVKAATIQHREFVDQRAQKEAWAANPEFPESPISDVSAEMTYTCSRNGQETHIPVSVESSFLMPGRQRRLSVTVNGPEGLDVLELDFDVPPTDGQGRAQTVDRLRRVSDGEVICEWGGDKSLVQLRGFLGSAPAERPDASATLRIEARIQDVLRSIGAVAAQIVIAGA